MPVSPTLPQTLSDALDDKGYSQLTPVQEAVTKTDLIGLDLLVSAQTGSGKTVGFGLAIASDLLDAQGQLGKPGLPLALIIAPTRELAMQVRREFDWLYAKAGIVTASAVGGLDTRTERRALERGAHVVVATPGRLRDHVARGVIDLGALRAVVLDEADEMLDMGFSEDLAYILDHTPQTRRTLLFSATVPRGIAKLAQAYQSPDTQRIEVGLQGAQHADITYRALNVVPSDVEKAIINLLRYHDARTAIIFANTRSMVARLTAKFANRGFAVVSLSGELSQSERSHALQALRDGRARVCIATDVAARGIDLPHLELVIHADLPQNAEALLHRSGRTGRAGRKGTSVLIVPGRQRSKAQRLLTTAKLDVEWGTPPSAEDVLARDEERMLADPAWALPPDAEERAFATRLLDTYAPEQIAAVYLRLFRDHNSAPEILSAPPEPGKPAKRAAAEFGDSVWFSLSLGRKHRAEPRWLLPMLCRNTGLQRSAIGAIRVQSHETYIEIQATAVPALRHELGSDLALEQGARLTELPGKPDLDSASVSVSEHRLKKPGKKKRPAEQLSQAHTEEAEPKPLANEVSETPRKKKSKKAKTKSKEKEKRTEPRHNAKNSEKPKSDRGSGGAGKDKRRKPNTKSKTAKRATQSKEIGPDARPKRRRAQNR